MIGKRVQELRLRKGYTLSELAERAGVAKSYLSTMERDIQSNPSIQFLEKIASVLGVSIESLIQEHTASQSGADNEETLDGDWSALVVEAMHSGVSKEEFRAFLEFNRWKQKKDKE